jgi:hypothetical protein
VLQGEKKTHRLNTEDEAGLEARLQFDLAGLCLCYKEAED